jgi:hypothetical protein
MKTQIRVMGGYASTDCIWQDTLFKIAAESVEIENKVRESLGIPLLPVAAAEPEIKVKASSKKAEQPS